MVEEKKFKSWIGKAIPRRKEIIKTPVKVDFKTKKGETISVPAVKIERKNKELISWECAYCGRPTKSSKRPTRCSCRNGYVKHIKIISKEEK